MIGPDCKEARQRFLQNYWTTQVRDLRHIVNGITPKALVETLLKKYKTYTVASMAPAPELSHCT